MEGADRKLRRFPPALGCPERKLRGRLRDGEEDTVMLAPNTGPGNNPPVPLDGTDIIVPLLGDDTARAHSTPQALAFRCRLILRAAQPDRPANGQVAQEFGCNRHTVALWRDRFLEHGLTGLQDAPRPGRPRRVSPRRTP